MSLNYKFSEDTAIAELKSYIDNTYSQHYNRNNFQATEFIIDGGHGEGFCIGNILKYAQRYGKKNGYTFIFGKNQAGSVIYGAEAKDITEVVTKAINEDYAANKDSDKKASDSKTSKETENDVTDS